MAGAGRGRVDKRRAIVEAAFEVFARRGYELASMQDVAEQAGVSKQTVYNHFQDKPEVFAEAMAVTADAVLAANLEAVELLRNPGADLRAALNEAAFAMLRICCDPRSTALRSLTYAQRARFPELVDVIQNRLAGRLGPAVADRLARLALSGDLRPCDPEQAAEQLLALLTAPVEARSRMGTRPVPDPDIKSIAEAATDTFLRAYAPSAPASV
ncbi:TetR/AcrR family transcriptional regulator [Actinocorallia sp. A-T 12471]|uniref:TetR/AcrR family transcriptional regulator n=1 Tax=Actinocorallia sp. A-T 12471 TaxID=3089813 RepID=UPI0029CF13F0|nr:TetR/AcrR family transcriptional regulator [Actinocorallia sp. A-T 12471]MDX6743130.1 TetR/AcrR family transcriptional regulator [Actinocorallia sp. A-T 12471]